MNKTILKTLAAAAIAIVCGGASAQTNVNPGNPNILAEGRTITKGEAMHFCYPGTAFTIRFAGSGSVSARLKANAGYYGVSVDGGGFRKISTHGYNDGVRDFVLAENLANGEHSIKLMLLTEELYRFPEFHGFALSDSKAKILKPDTKKRLKIEFIGNSITCGYGNEASRKEDHFADSTSNFSKSFAGLTIKNLNAIAMVVARSGIGIYKNYGDTITGSEWPMPKVYCKTLINDKETNYDFSGWRPDVVVVGLGTNDLSEHNYKEEKFRVAYAAFIKDIRKRYPTAHIVMLNSPMLHYEQAGELQIAISNTMTAMIQAGDTKIHQYTQFRELEDDNQYGADWHPNAAFHAEMAKYFSYYIKTEVAKRFFKQPKQK